MRKIGINMFEVIGLTIAFHEKISGEIATTST